MPLRVCVLNVHSWADATGTGRIDDVIELLRGIASDVVMLNEVPEDGGLQRVAGALSMHASYAPAAYAGNAMLTRAPLGHVTALAINAPRGEMRSALIGRIVVDGRAYTVACTHLDHRREVTRLAQLATVHAEIERRKTTSKNGDTVVFGGDFNALRPSDYPAPFFDAVRAHREKNGWEAPAGNVVARLDAWGYVDAARLADAGSLAAYPSSLTRPIAASLASTCWARTRIDYVWLSPGLTADLARVDAAVADVDVSDHRPLVVTLRHRS